MPVALLLAMLLTFAAAPGVPIASAHTNASSRTSENTSVSTSSAQSQLIVVSLSKQWLYAYQGGQEVFNTAIMSGRPTLPTPTGTFHVFAKLSPTTFYSPFPPGSPNWYPPTDINYALVFDARGSFLHASLRHSAHGPATTGWDYVHPVGWPWGSNGCVAMPLSAASWLYHWAPIGTTVQVTP